MTLTLRIPLLTTTQKYSLYSLQAVPFSSDGKICKIEVPSHVAISSQTSAHSAIRTFQPKKSLGLLNDINLPTTEQRCIAALLSPTATLNDLRNYCPFQCFSTNQISILHIDERNFIITNAANLTAHCGTARHSLATQATTVGALQVHLPCNCSLYANTDKIIETKFPCLRPDTKPASIRFVPHAWTHLPSTIYISQISKIPNLTAILSEDWNKFLPNEPHLQNATVTVFDWSFVQIVSNYIGLFHWVTFALLAWIIVRTPSLLWGLQNANRTPKSSRRRHRIYQRRPLPAIPRSQQNDSSAEPPDAPPPP
ncbi:uncharacterized protein LOC132198836 [Neocloeon triangulifer]|uniref:uncharacterized protein LOC132198836 n=1 Tax=Neocloeon triangulifer TaxID=2078957 RepID=UPI00286F6FFB|nr:uncharacterized protein LOC132198836 [Neocloeon triangulifer]